MKLFLVSSIMSLWLIICLSGHSQAINKKFEDLKKLIGTWKMETKKGALYEKWWMIDDSSLKSKSYKVNDKDTTLLEEVDLVKVNNTIAYIPTVHGENDNQPVKFAMIKSKNGIYAFENTEHDFPQRVIYDLSKNKTLHAWIEGNDKGQFKRFDYNYEKVF